MRRALSLSREHLATLTPDDLSSVVGADAWTFPQCQVELVKELTDGSLALTRRCA